MLTSVRGDAGYGQAPNPQQTPRADTSRLPPMGNFAPTPTANRDNKRKRGERQGPGATVAAMPTPVPQEAPTSNLRGVYGQGTINKVRCRLITFSLSVMIAHLDKWRTDLVRVTSSLTSFDIFILFSCIISLFSQIQACTQNMTIPHIS